jgi:hypothetical protein
MKKLSLLLVSILCLGVLNAGAQGFIVKGGWNYSQSDVKGIKDGHSGWQAGVGFQTEATHGFSFQPELLYKVNGLKFSDGANLRLSHLELPLNVQWGPDLLIARPFVFAGPFVGYNFRPSGKGITQEEVSALRRFEWGVGVGLGLNIWKIQIAGKYNWNFGSFADVTSAQAAMAHFDSLKGHPRTFEISVGLRF